MYGTETTTTTNSTPLLANVRCWHSANTHLPPLPPPHHYVNQRASIPTHQHIDTFKGVRQLFWTVWPPQWRRGPPPILRWTASDERGTRGASRGLGVFFSSLSITLNFYYLQLDHMYRNGDESPRHISPANLRRMGFQTHPRRVLGIFLLL